VLALSQSRAMRGISKETITEKVKDVIYETGLMSPRSAITTRQRFREDYGMEDEGQFAALTNRVNGQFQPYGITISTPEMEGCERVSDLIDLLAKRRTKLKIARIPGIRRRRRAKKPAKRRGGRRRP
jgi:acyl carrier protein